MMTTTMMLLGGWCLPLASVQIHKNFPSNTRKITATLNRREYSINSTMWQWKKCTQIVGWSVSFSKSTSNVSIFVYIDVVYMKTTFQLDEIICGWMGECIFTAAGKISPHYDSYAHTRKTNIVISTVHHKSTTIWVNKSHSLTLIEWGSKMSVSVCGVCCCHRFCFLFFSTGARFWTVNVSSVFIAIYCYIALKLIKIDFVLFSSFELYFYIRSLWFQPGKRFQFTMILNTLILPIFNHIHSCFGFLCSTPIFSPFSRATCFILNQRVE